MKVLVTGATGRLGSVVCKELFRLGHDVRGTDQRFLAGLGVPLTLADLRDPHAVYPLLEGRDAVVHLGNIPNLSFGPSPQVVLGDNVRMNANVFRAAVDLGVGRIVFASSLQAMIRLDEGRAPDAAPIVPYFPLDGDAPTNPGHNFYGLSKEFGERMLRIFSERFPLLTCTALRFPMLAGDWFKKRLEQPHPPSALNFCEALAYLDFSDAATLVGLVLERQRPGYPSVRSRAGRAARRLQRGPHRLRVFSADAGALLDRAANRAGRSLGFGARLRISAGPPTDGSARPALGAEGRKGWPGKLPPELFERKSHPWVGPGFLTGRS